MNRFLPYDKSLVDKARKLRREMTAAERKLWFQFFRQLSLRVLRQRPIDRYIVDFYCPSAGLVIEIDGDSHYRGDAEQRDEERTRVLESFGLRVVRFTNSDVLLNFDGVVEVVQGLLDIDPPSIPPC